MIALNGKEFEETLSEKVEENSLDQYAYWYGGIIDTCLQTEMFGGWDKDEVDSYFCDLFLSYKKVMIIDGEAKEITIKQGKTDVGKKRFTKLIEEVITWLAKNDIIIKPSEEYNLSKYRTVKK